MSRQFELADRVARPRRPPEVLFCADSTGGGAVNTRARSLVRFLAAASLAALALPCSAQAYPAKPILMLMPLQAGSAVDVMIRIVAQKMGEDMGRQILIENQPGAAGSIGAERVKRSAADGYTVGVLNDSILTMIPNIRQVAYDPVKDFVPVDRKSTRLNSSHANISYAVFCLKKKKKNT